LTAKPGRPARAAGFQDDGRLRVIGKPFDAPVLWSALADLDRHFA